MLVLAAVLVVPVVILVPVFLPGDSGPAVLTSADREAIGDPGLDRGADPVPPAALPSAAESVARAYLRAAHGGDPGDDGRSRRDAVAYAAPGSPAALGAPVLDPPGPGERRIAEVEALDPAGTATGGDRTAFVAQVRTTTAAPGAAPRTERWRTRLVLHRGIDGRWAVAADTPITTDTPDVND
ncbi:hypothetical protein AFB00_08040 [Pseudonocardia sp. HH130630-07]|nr:hypothetical protein AFB00_08040 [Pseudonocardia sp. HH130630-07]